MVVLKKIKMIVKMKSESGRLGSTSAGTSLLEHALCVLEGS